MDKWHKGLVGALILALICIIFLQQCRKSPEIETEIVKVDTTIYITIYDTLWHDTTRFNYFDVPIPKPYYDTVLVKVNDFDFDEDFILKYPATYTDIISDDTVSIEYTLLVRGYLDDIKIGYKLLQPFLIEQTTLIETEVTKRERSTHLYIGIDIGANKDKFGYFTPELELTTRRYNYSAGFNILDKSVIIGLKRRIL